MVGKKKLGLFFVLWYPPFNRVGGSYEVPVACTAEAEIIGTIFEEHIVAFGILKHICYSKNSRMIQIKGLYLYIVYFHHSSTTLKILQCLMFCIYTACLSSHEYNKTGWKHH